MTDILDLAREFLDEGVPGTANIISNMFDQAEIVEDEIEKGQARHPHASQQIWECFKMLGTMKASDFGSWHDDLFRSHCIELIDRAGNKEDTRPPTWAEMMIAVSTFTLENAPTTQAAAVYLTLFKHAVPEDSDVWQSWQFIDKIAQEKYGPQAAVDRWLKTTLDIATVDFVNATIAQMKRRMAIKDRVAPELKQEMLI